MSLGIRPDVEDSSSASGGAAASIPVEQLPLEVQPFGAVLLHHVHARDGGLEVWLEHDAVAPAAGQDLGQLDRLSVQQLLQVRTGVVQPYVVALGREQGRPGQADGPGADQPR